ncbi:MAG: hypothetical protein HY741_20715, partial [Chloroflexi bacterium]|nr:hypothetical protein [Chloroflexota bacterium]
SWSPKSWSPNAQGRGDPSWSPKSWSPNAQGRGDSSWSPKSWSPKSWSPNAQGKHKALPLLFFIIVELAALYSHYYEALILLALNLFVFATMWRDLKKLAQWLGAQMVLAALYLPYPLILSNRVSAYGEGSGRQGVALWDLARETFSAFTVGETLDAEWRAWLWIPFALLALLGLIFLWQRDWKRGLFFALYAGVPTVAVFALNTIRPLYLERYLNGVAPAYYLLLAFGITGVFDLIDALRTNEFVTTSGVSRTNKFVTTFHVSRFTFHVSRLTFHASRFTPHVSRLVIFAALALVAALALFNYWTNPAFAKAPDWRGLTDIINANAQPGDLIVQNFPETSLVYYDRTKLPLVVYPETFLPDTKTTQQLNALNANYLRVWFIPAAPDYWDPDSFVEKWLVRRGDLVNQWRVDTLRLQLYATASQYLNTMTKSGAVFGETLTLLGYRVDMQSTPSKLVLYWRVSNAPAHDFRIRLRYRDDAEGRAAEGLYTPSAPEYPTSFWRKNETVVSQLALSSDAQRATELRLSVCDGNGKNCLELTAPKKSRDKNELLIPLQ